MNMLLMAGIDFGDVFGQILPRLPEVGAQLLATLIALFMVYKFAWKPMRKFIATRQEYIESNIKNATNATQAADESKVQAEEILKQAHVEYKATVDSAKVDAIKVREEIISQADAEAKRKLDTAKTQIENEKVKAREEIEKEIIDVALAAAEKVIGREINENDNRKIISEFVKDIEK